MSECSCGGNCGGTTLEEIGGTTFNIGYGDSVTGPRTWKFCEKCGENLTRTPIHEPYKWDKITGEPTFAVMVECPNYRSWGDGHVSDAYFSDKPNDVEDL